MEIFYVYIYLNPLKPGKFDFGLNCSFLYEPFYVGKGYGNRCEYGLKYSNFTSNFYKKNTINKIIKNGHQPIIVKLNENLIEEKAFDLECLVIDKIGRKNLKKGPLVNLTDGGEGRKDKSDERIKLMSKPVLQYKGDELICEFSSIKEAVLSTGIITVGRASSGVYKTAGGFRWVYKYPEDILQGHLTSPIKGKKHTEETKNKLKKKRSDLTRERLSLSQQNKKSVYQYDLDKNLIKIWVSTGSIERELRLSRSTIRKCCNGEYKTGYSFIWSWKLL